MNPFSGYDFLQIHNHCHPRPFPTQNTPGSYGVTWPQTALRTAAASIASIGHLVVSFEIQAPKGLVSDLTGLLTRFFWGGAEGWPPLQVTGRGGDAWCDETCLWNPWDWKIWCLYRCSFDLEVWSCLMMSLVLSNMQWLHDRFRILRLHQVVTWHVLFYSNLNSGAVELWRHPEKSRLYSWRSVNVWGCNSRKMNMSTPQKAPNQNQSSFLCGHQHPMRPWTDYTISEGAGYFGWIRAVECDEVDLIDVF